MTRWFGARSALIAVALSTLSPVGGAALAQETALNQVDPGRGFSRASRAYSQMDPRYVRPGNRRTVAQVRSVDVGESKQELQGAIGRPVLAYGDGSWEFHLALPLTQSDTLVCQYRVFFDAQDRVESAVWRRPQCADLVLNGGS